MSYIKKGVTSRNESWKLKRRQSKKRGQNWRKFTKEGFGGGGSWLSGEKIKDSVGGRITSIA